MCYHLLCRLDKSKVYVHTHHSVTVGRVAGEWQMSGAKLVWWREPTQRSRRVLVGVAWAGAGATVFRSWGHVLGDETAVAGLRLAGRESRTAEVPRTDARASVEDLIDDVAGQLQGLPVAVAGVCSGAPVAVELARELHRRGVRVEAAAVVSFPPPGHPTGASALRGQCVESRLQRMGVEIDPRVFDIARTAVEADFAVADQYAASPLDPVPCPLIAIRGRSDPSVTASHIGSWRRATEAYFVGMSVEGNHLFSDGRWDDLGLSLERTLDRLADQGARNARVRSGSLAG